MGLFAQSVNGGSFGQQLGTLYDVLRVLSPGGGAQGGMDFQDDAQLDPSQVEFRGPQPGIQPFGPWGHNAFRPGFEVQQHPDDQFGFFQTGLGTDLFSLEGLLGGFLPGSPGMSGVGGGGLSGGAPLTGRGGSSFTAAPPGEDFGGYDVTPDNLISRQGMTGVPEAIRTLLAAERRLGLPGLSDAVIGEGYRSSEQQAALYADHLAGRHPAPVAPPGKSYHEQGEAFDISSDWLAANPRVTPWLERHGFTFDVPGEPWHAHYVGGGRPLRPSGTGRPIAGTSTLTPATGNGGRPRVETHRTPFTSNRPPARVRRPAPAPYLRQRR